MNVKLDKANSILMHPRKAPQSIVETGLQSSVPSGRLLQPHIPTIRNASQWTASSHLVLGFLIDLVLWNSPFRTCLVSFLLPFLRCNPSKLVS